MLADGGEGLVGRLEHQGEVIHAEFSRDGTRVLTRVLSRRSIPFEKFLAAVQAQRPTRVPGAAVFLTAHTSGTPEVISRP